MTVAEMTTLATDVAATYIIPVTFVLTLYAGYRGVRILLGRN